MPRETKKIYRTGLLNSDGNGYFAPEWWHIPKNFEQALTIKEACEQYCYSRSGILRKVKKGDIYGCRVGCRWAIFPAGLKNRCPSKNL